MPKDRFAAKRMRDRVRMEEYTDPALLQSIDRAVDRQVAAPAPAPKQSVEEFLSQGGEIKKIPQGERGVRKFRRKLPWRP